MYVCCAFTAENDEYFKPWTEWSPCSRQCNPHETRTRTRMCTLAGGRCNKIGPTSETQACDKVENCARECYVYLNIYVYIVSTVYMKSIPVHAMVRILNDVEVLPLGKQIAT